MFEREKFNHITYSYRKNSLENQCDSNSHSNMIHEHQRVLELTNSESKSVQHEQCNKIVSKEGCERIRNMARAAVDGAKAFDAPHYLFDQDSLTAKMISACDPHVPVLCVTKNLRLSRQLQIYRGLLPLVLPTPSVIGIHYHPLPRSRLTPRE